MAWKAGAVVQCSGLSCCLQCRSPVPGAPAVQVSAVLVHLERSAYAAGKAADDGPGAGLCHPVGDLVERLLWLVQMWMLWPVSK